MPFLLLIYCISLLLVLLTERDATHGFWCSNDYSIKGHWIWSQKEKVSISIFPASLNQQLPVTCVWFDQEEIIQHVSFCHSPWLYIDHALSQTLLVELSCHRSYNPYHLNPSLQWAQNAIELGGFACFLLSRQRVKLFVAKCRWRHHCEANT